jgi:arylsulfatase A-like enzyme
MSGLEALWPPKDARLAREARRPGQGRYDQEWGPSWRDIPNFDVDLPFYGFEHVSLITDHADTVHGHYRRWLERHHPEIAAVAGDLHALPAPGYTLVQSKQAWRTRVPEECSTTSWIADETLALLENYSVAAKPFFIQCSFPDPHHPFTPPGRFWDMYRPEEVSLPASFHDASAPPPHVAWLRTQRDSGKAVKHTPAVFACTEREAREAIALNYGSITHIDGAIGRILGALEDLGLAENTVCIFTSDHGDFLGDHQLLLKGPIHYQGLIRTPLIWSDPLGPKGVRSDRLCSTIDLAPTILDRAGTAGFNGIQGRSMLPLMSDESTSWRESVLIEEEGQRVMFGFTSRVRMRSLVTRRWRLSLYHGTSLGEIYDLQEDPLESRNLWDDPTRQDVKRDLLLELTQQMIGFGETSPYPSALA